MPPSPADPTAPLDPSTSAPPAAPRPGRRGRRWLAAAAVALVAYALLGFLLAPRLLQRALRERGTAALHRTVTVADVKVNPFTLAVTVIGLEVKDLDAPRLAGWDSLYVRLAPWKALRGDLGVAEIRLTRPFGRLALDAAGRLNVQDLLAGDAAAAEPAPPGAPPSTLGVALDRLEIEEARLVFEDASRAPAFQTTLGPLTIRLSDFRTRGGADSPYAFTGTTELGETFTWSGTVLSEPLRSSGAIAFGAFKLPKYDPYLKEQAPALFIETGTVSLDARYQLEWGATNRRLSLAGLKVVVEDLALARRRDRSRALQLPRVEVTGGEVDLLGQEATVAEVKVVGARLQPRREADGRMALLEMLERPAPTVTATRPATPAPAPTTTTTTTTTKKDAPGWRWSVQALTVERAVVEAEDLAPPRPVRLSLPEVNVRLTGLAGRPDVACPLTASLRWGEAGTASAKGTVWPFAQRADLTLQAEGLDLAPLGPYLDAAVPARLAEAQLGLSARTTFDGAGGVPAWTFAGDVRLSGLSLRHPARNEELVRWRSLELLGLDAASKGTRASLKTVRLTEPRIRAIVFEDGTTSMGGAAPPAATSSTPAEGSTPATAAPPAPPPPARPPATGPAWRTAIGLLQVVRGRVSFVDRSVKPPVLLSLTDVEARIANLSSDPRVRSTVDVRAKVDGAAPVTVTGTLNPLQALAYTDLVVSARGVDLTPLDPYAGRHLGYGLQKGKLDLELAYRVQEKAIQAGNVVKVDQLTLGEATSSPDATSIPVRLALALLKDADGLILLDVPVEGRTDDPEFRLGRVIWRTLLNVLVKVASSPFSALASLVGGGKEDISLVEFPPGSARLDDAGKKRIELLARSLAQRPGLSLELEPTVDAAADHLALRRAELERQLRRAKAARLKPPPAAEAIDALELLPEERPRLVEALHAATFPVPAAPPRPAAGAPPAAPLPPPPTPAEQEARLLEIITFQPEEIPTLLGARYAAAQEALVASGLDPSRLFSVQGGGRAAKESGSRVYFTVR
jgi:hypothetical protein